MTGAVTILGIDPGVTGGIDLLLPDGSIVADDIPVVGGELDVDTLLQQVRTFSSGLAMVERAIAMPKQSVSSTFKFGVAYSALRTVVALCSIPYRYPLKSKPCRGGYLDGALSSRSATRPSELVP